MPENVGQNVEGENAAGKEQEKDQFPVKALPTVDVYIKTYAKSMGNNDLKAGKLFVEYENADRVRRLKSELASLVNNKVAPHIVEKVLGKVRLNKAGTSSKWAVMMLGVVK